MKKGYGLIFSAIIVISIVFHLFNLSQPDKPVFDEVYFATFAADYARSQPVFDVHPPLGKIIYSIPLFFVRDNLNDRNSTFFLNEKVGKEVRAKPNFKPFHDFPYVTLRFISAVFGILLTVAVYLFIKNFTQNETAALLGMFFVAFENAMLLETRLILLNGMYLTFGFLALAFFFSKKSKSVLAGILLGLALSVKLIAIVFVGPTIFNFLLSDSQKRKELKRKLLLFFVTGGIIFLLVIFLANNLLVSVSERLQEYSFFLEEKLPSAEVFYGYPVFYQKIIPYLQAIFIEINNMISGYAYVPNSSHPFASEWFQWPLMQKPMVYDYSGSKTLFLLGNPAVWLIGLMAVIYAILKRKNLVLLGSYVFALVPFMLVQRVTFLYHYFPALIFAICLAALIISKKLTPLPLKEKKKWLIVICSAVILFFGIVSPFTFGF